MKDDIDSLDVELGETDEYPIGVAALRKGQTLDTSELISKKIITGQPGTAAWAFALLRLRDYIQRRSIELGKPLSCRCRDNGIYIHTDSEASHYHSGRAGQAQDSIGRQVRNLARLVDASKLTAQGQVEHTRQLCLWGAKLQMLRKAQRKIAARQDSEQKNIPRPGEAE